MMDEDWNVLTGLFPSNWRALAISTGALKGLRKNKSESALLRTILMHLGCGYSLRETVVRAKQSGLADLSDVALLKRLKKCKEWLHALCLSLLAERGLASISDEKCLFRLFDATHISEPGKTGSVWRVHYSIQIPSLRCDYFKLTPTKGEGVGESFGQYPIKAGDYILADRGYSLVSGMEYVQSKGAFFTIRLNPNNVVMKDFSGGSFDLLERLKRLKKTGVVRTWPVQLTSKGKHAVAGRLCVLRKTQESIRRTHAKLKLRASRQGSTLKKQTLVYGEYVIVFTTFPEEEFSASRVLECYRMRWQIELIFKRFKQIAKLGHLPKHDDESAQAWLYGKLFIALMTEKLIDHASSISPWGYKIESQETAQSLA